MKLTGRVDDIYGAGRTSITDHRAFHLASLRDAAVGVLRGKRLPPEYAVRGSALTGAHLPNQDESNIRGARGARHPAVAGVAAVSAAAHRCRTSTGPASPCLSRQPPPADS